MKPIYIENYIQKDLLENLMQYDHFHKIPKSDRKQLIPRISLTFRNLIQHE
ncbi:MAG: hypothetical protein LC122_12320 [Chitinophagales bacterium]|nr:hypothetical protein [Chitinophagales bacterium]